MADFSDDAERVPGLKFEVLGGDPVGNADGRGDVRYDQDCPIFFEGCRGNVFSLEGF